jgi:glyoxylase-like metal-dependent hydrolase (beta-lactamase superfamily II)
MKILQISLISALLPSMVLAQAGRGAQPALQIQPIKPALYMVTGAGANSLIRITNDGVVLVDGKLSGDQNYSGLMDQIKTVTDKPVKFVIVTHHHADHTGNNAKFLAAGAQIVGHANLAKNLETYQSPNFDAHAAMPTITYDKEYVVRLGGAAVEVKHFGRSHTSGDSIVYFRDLKVVALSDALTTGGQGPLIDYAGGGSALEWKKVFEETLKLDFDAAIPGNGPVLTKADVQAYATKFNTVIDRATELVRKGVPKDQLLMQLKTDDIGWAPRIPSIDGLYAELGSR